MDMFHIQSAFYELLHGTSFEDSLIAAISRGGDTDTNGSRYGVDEIPEKWISTVTNSRPRSELNVIDHNVERIVKKLLILNR
ncbi:unnamed protein product [Gongylonema pulchrum]|uniref:Hydrolase n=1 Tax=Gongylonema pulchrum TaxID=637853 RepID=A0A183D183_9BILA|nr:unnamed protein product [Gongylonema pulchrum]